LKIAFKDWLDKKRLQKRKELKESKSKKKDKLLRPKTEHKEVFLAYSYMKKIRKPKGIKNRSIVNNNENIGIFEEE